MFEFKIFESKYKLNILKTIYKKYNIKSLIYNIKIFIYNILVMIYKKYFQNMKFACLQNLCIRYFGNS